MQLASTNLSSVSPCHASSSSHWYSRGSVRGLNGLKSTNTYSPYTEKSHQNLSYLYRDHNNGPMVCHYLLFSQHIKYIYRSIHNG